MPGIDIKVSAKVWNPLHFVEITQREEEARNSGINAEA
jgi:hypothetical protein